jgi:hypothetical protein
MRSAKPITYKNYGSISHLPGSRLGPAEHTITGGQLSILTVKPRDKHDKIFVEEKLDGSNVGIIRLDDEIIPLTRTGFTAKSSPFKQHHMFHDWVMKQINRFLSYLDIGQRIVGEWLVQAHGTRYALTHEPFVAFDIMNGPVERLPREKFYAMCHAMELTTPKLLNPDGLSMTIEAADAALGEHGFHGAVDRAEGVVYRLERTRRPNKHEKGSGDMRPFVEFLAKYVRSDKVDGKYLFEDDGNGGRRQCSKEIWNVEPGK